MLRKFITGDGKYTTTNENGYLRVYRYDTECKEVWREDDLIGDKYVLSLVQQIEELEDKLVDNKNTEQLEKLFIEFVTFHQHGKLTGNKELQLIEKFERITGKDFISERENFIKISFNIETDEY